MRPLQGLVWCCALTALAGTGSSAHAAWNNVFQVCCASCGGAPAPAVASYAPVAAGYGDPGCCPQPCPQPCPQQVCTTRYVQRCYYQPVTTYRTSSYYEPVTTYRTSYYYQPVTSYRYSCYYDPCTCRYQSVAQPCTSYQLRSRCCPVTSYLQRTCCTPVTSYQQAFYYEPVTTCCTTTTGAPVMSLPPGAAVVPQPGAGAPPPGAGAPPPGAGAPPPGAGAPPPPHAGETREPLPPPPPGTVPGTAPPAVGETREPGSPTSESNRLDRNPVPPTMPRSATESNRDPATLPPVVRFDRIASRAGHNLEGRLLDNARAPRSGARVLFVSCAGKTIQRSAITDSKGTFRAQLDKGGWLVYTYDERGRPVFSRRIEVPGDRGVTMTLVGR